MREISDETNKCNCALCTFSRKMDKATEFEMFYSLDWEHADFVATLHDPQDYAEYMEIFANVKVRSNVFN